MSKYTLQIILLIFIILIFSTYLIIKHCKKRVLKSLLLSIIILIALYLVTLSIDINTTYSMKNPIFAKESSYMVSMVRYEGLGYTIGLEKNGENGEIIQSQMIMFGKVIAAAINIDTFIDKDNISKLNEPYKKIETIYNYD